MFVDKPELIAIFETELAAWEELLAGLSPAQITSRSLPDGLAIKDVMAHLAAWQQRTSARLEAALHDHEPHFPQWPVALAEEEASAVVDQANAWILATNRDRPWPAVHQEWRAGFLRFLELVKAIPAADLRPEGKLAWMADYQFSAVLAGAYDHHHSEHRGLLVAWLRAQPAS